MLQLEVWVGERLAGSLTHDAETNLFAFVPNAEWDLARDGVALNRAIAKAAPPAVHSKSVRNFFENLLPEGQALDDTARSLKTSKSNLLGLLAALGAEMPGAVRVLPPGGARIEPMPRREIRAEELSMRIRQRPDMPFTVWDGRVRLSIAGFQDKVAVLLEGDRMFFADGGQWASTHILKPEPVSSSVAGMTSNEFFCMRLAQAIGMRVAPVRLLHVPDPVLCVQRFDRRLRDGGVDRFHVIDGCQLMDLSRDQKYERMGTAETVRHIRDGASYPMLFSWADAAEIPLVFRDDLMHWAIFQVLIGNADAHAKNISFFSGPQGLHIAPAYDLLSTLAFPRVETELAMGIGDGFKHSEIGAFQWVDFAQSCGLSRRILERAIARMIESIERVSQKVGREVVEEGADAAVVRRIQGVMDPILSDQRRQASMIRDVSLDLLSAAGPEMF